MTVEDLPRHLDELVAKPPKERVLLTKNGKPFAFVSDASIYDEEDIGYMTDPKFWEMIRARRRQKGGVPLEQVMARIEQEERQSKNAKGAKIGKGRRDRKRNGTA